MLVEALTPSRIRSFMSKVQIHEGADCWLYMGDLNRDRPRVTLGGVKAEAYRWSWAIAYQRDPVGLVLHSCDNSRCVNPAHLREGTHHENNQDAVERGRVRNQFSDRKECKRGHDLTRPGAYYNSPGGRRECAECKLVRRTNRTGQ